MRRSIVLSVATVFLLLAGTSAISSSAQDAANDQTPTFYRLVPGTYVNGWPRCTVHYPKDWPERFPAPQEIFRAGAPDTPAPGGSSAFLFVFAPYCAPFGTPLPQLDKVTDRIVSLFRRIATDVTVLYDRPSRLRDGTPARESEIRFVINGVSGNGFNLTAQTNKSGQYLINMGLAGQPPEGTIREDLKAILYSIECDQNKDRPVTVPPDVQELLHKTSSAFVAHDFAQAMTNYSDRYLNSGRTKIERERFYREVFGSITSFEFTITDFVPAGEKAYLTGYATTNLGAVPVIDTAIIKEDGQWKWYGNQRDPAP
jgi:hypothetical protein